MASVSLLPDGDQVSSEQSLTEEARWSETNLENFGEFCFETDQLALKGILLLTYLL